MLNCVVLDPSVAGSAERVEGVKVFWRWVGVVDGTGTTELAVLWLSRELVEGGSD